MNIPQNGQTISYTIAIALISALAILAVVSVSWLRPEADNTGIVTMIFGFAAATLLQIFSLLKQVEVKAVAVETHAAVNSRMTKFEETLERLSTVKQQLARGEGKDEGRAEADKRTDQLAVSVLASVVKPDVTDPLVLSSPVVEQTLKAIDANTKAIDENTKKTDEKIDKMKADPPHTKP